MRLRCVAALLVWLWTAGVLAQDSEPVSHAAMLYPPIARAARVSGDVKVTYLLHPDGTASEVQAVDGPVLLRSVAVEQVKSWRFASGSQPVTATVVFHFRFRPDDPERDSAAGRTEVHFLDPHVVDVIGPAASDVSREGCPAGMDRVPPQGGTPQDFVETGWPRLRVEASGAVLWNPPGEWDAPDWSQAKRKTIESGMARALIERFRAEAFWRLCRSYFRPVSDTEGSFIAASVGGLSRRVDEHAGDPPAIFGELLDAIHETTNSHEWRVGDPREEKMGDLPADVWLPKPGRTQLMADAYHGTQEKAEAELLSGEKVNDADGSGWTPLMYAAGGYNTGSVIGLLLKSGADVNAKGLHGETPLMFAALMGVAADELLDAGADVNAKGDEGSTALMLLAQSGDAEDLKELLKAGADARAKDAAGRTAMDYLLAADCGVPIVSRYTHPFMNVVSGSCREIETDALLASTKLLNRAGAFATRAWAPSSEVSEH